MKPIALDRNFLAECFSYSPLTGVLRWKNRPLSHFKNEAGMNTFNGKFEGKIAGWRVFRRDGKPHHIRVEIRIPEYGKSVSLTAHRIALVLSGIEISDKDGDHRNGNPFDNRIENIRPANKYESARNRGLFNKRSGLPKGVRKERGGKFVARIRASGNQYLGAFRTSKEASLAYESAAASNFGEFYRP